MLHLITMIVIDTVVPSGLKEFVGEELADFPRYIISVGIYSPQSITTDLTFNIPALGLTSVPILLYRSNFYACVLFDIGA